MLSLKVGRFGQYWGNDFNSSSYLNSEQMSINARYIYNYLTDKGWTLNAIAGTLGNIQAESTINPGCWQSHNVGGGPAYGLVQWDPFTKYTNWCSQNLKNPEDMDSNLDRIIWELNNDEQYYATPSYPESFSEFTKSTKSVEYLTTAFLKNYERAGVERLEERISYANHWYNFLKGDTPIEPDDPVITYKRKTKFNFILFNKNRRNYEQRNIFRKNKNNWNM